MSGSLYNGGLIGAVDPDRRPRVADDGNWSLQGTTESPPWRAALLLVNQARLFGYRPEAQREAFAVAVLREGVFLRQELLDWRGPQLQPGDVFEIILTGGTRYLGWGDTAGEDWMEWASLDPIKLTPVIATTGKITIPSTQPEPPAAAPNAKQTRSEMTRVANLWMPPAVQPKTARITLARRITSPLNTDQIWFSGDSQLDRKILALLDEYGVPK